MVSNLARSQNSDPCLACDCKFRNDFRAQVGRGLNIAAERTNNAWKRHLESTKTLYVRTWSTWSSERVEMPQSLIENSQNAQIHAFPICKKTNIDGVGEMTPGGQAANSACRNKIAVPLACCVPSNSFFFGKLPRH